MSEQPLTARALVVVSYYDRRPIDDLHRLVESIAQFPSGAEFDVCIVVNRTCGERIVVEKMAFPVEIVYRDNLGMNIGAWDYGWRTHRSYDDYLFLQDECYVVRKDWLAAFRRRGAEPGIGMIGESLNSSWDRSWSDLRKEQEGVLLTEHRIDGKCVNRVDYYLKFFQEVGITHGPSGRHLRSLVWYFRGDVLSQMGSFPQGRNYAECIAAEIGVSKRVEGLGLRVEQIHDEPFRYIRHREWNRDHLGAPFTHSSTIKRRIDQLEDPPWRILGRMFARKLSHSVLGGKERGS